MARLAIECTICKKIDSCEEGKPLPRCYDCFSPTRLSETAADISDEDLELIDKMVEDFFDDLEFGDWEDDDD